MSEALRGEDLNPETCYGLDDPDFGVNLQGTGANRLGLRATESQTAKWQAKGRGAC